MTELCHVLFLSIVCINRKILFLFVDLKLGRPKGRGISWTVDRVSGKQTKSGTQGAERRRGEERQRETLALNISSFSKVHRFSLCCIAVW